MNFTPIELTAPRRIDAAVLNSGTTHAGIEKQATSRIYWADSNADKPLLRAPVVAFAETDQNLKTTAAAIRLHIFLIGDFILTTAHADTTDCTSRSACNARNFSRTAELRDAESPDFIFRAISPHSKSVKSKTDADQQDPAIVLYAPLTVR